MALLNSVPLNHELLNGPETSDLLGSGSGDLLQFEQKVVILASGDVLQFEQQVLLNITTSGDLLQIEQQVKATASGDILQFGQRVIAADSHFYTANGFEPIVTIGGNTVDADNLVGNIQVTFTEGDSAIAVVRLLLDAGTYDLYDYQAKTITIDIRRSTGVTRIFTGWVDLPEAEPLIEQLTLNCVAEREDLITSKLAEAKNFVGLYSPVISSQELSVYDEVEERLKSVAQSLDFDGNNNYTLTSWTPKATADYSLGSSSIYRRDPKVTIERRKNIVNKVNLNFKYSYVRSYHATASYVWIHPYLNGGVCTFLKDFPDTPSKAMIESAINSAGWQVNTSAIGYTNLIAGGAYNCSGTTVIWSTLRTEYQTAVKQDANGNNITDVNGNTVYSTIPTNIVDMNDTYAMGAAWNASTRFNQNITEDFNATVQSTTSQARYGVKERNLSFTYVDDDKAESWEQYDKHNNTAPAGAVTTPDKSAYYLDNDSNSTTFNIAMLTALAQAKNIILEEHRDTKISFQRDFWDVINLKHTVELTGKWVQGKGKVFSYTHNIDLNNHIDHYTEVMLKTYRSTASETDDALNAPTRPSETIYSPAFVTALQSHYGQEPVERWNGHIGNKWVITPLGGNRTDTKRTTYQEQFRVDTPNITDTYRNTRTLTASASYGVNIPTDNTSIITYGFTE